MPGRISYPYVYALAASGSDLYVGGTTGDGSRPDYIAKWNRSNWTTLDSGMNGGISALAASGSDLYVGGNFTSYNGTAVNRLVRLTATGTVD